MGEEDFLREVNDRLKEARNHFHEWRQEAREDYDFVAGDQWDSEDKQLLKDELRPIITFNRVGPVIDSIVGHQVQNRHETKYVPREIGDVGVNEVLTAAAKWIRDGTDSEDEETDAFMDSVICGYGWVETRMDYEEDPDGIVLESRVDPFEMWPDPRARKRNLTDAKYLFRVKDMSREEFEDMFPDFDIDTLGGEEEYLSDIEDGEIDTVDPGDDYRDPDNPITKKGKFKVIEYQWCERVPYYRVQDPQTGQLANFEAEKFEALREHVPDLEHVKMNRKVYRRAYICRGEVIEKGPAPYEGGFNYNCITGKRDRNKGTFYGVVRAMKDPQRWANKWLSQVLHIINSNSKGGLLAEKGAFQNPRKAEEQWSDPSAVIHLNPGGLGKIQQKESINYPSGLDHLMQFAVGSIREVSGVNPEFLGQADRQQSGLLEQTRHMAGITILATIFDSLRKYYKQNGRMLLWFIRRYISDGRLVRLVGDDGLERFVPLVRQPDTVKYDVIVDESPTSRNQKQQVWELIIQMMPILSTQPVPPEIWAELLKYSPLPMSVSQKIGQQLTKPRGPSPEEQKAQLEAQHKQEMAGIKKFSAETDRIAALAKIQSDTTANDIDKLEVLVKAFGLDVDMERVRTTALGKADENRIEALARADENRVREIAALKPAAGTG